MKHLLVITFILASTPALAGGYVFDLPRLSWPTETDAPVAQGCIKPATIAPTCSLSN